MTYDLTYSIPNDIYWRGSAQPRPTVAKTWWAKFISAFGLVVIIAVMFAFLFYYVPFTDLEMLLLYLGTVLGVMIMFTAWIIQHRKIQKTYLRHNETNGPSHTVASAEGILAELSGVKSEIQWSFVQMIWPVRGATVVDLGASRLIVPDDALPHGTTQPEFIAQPQAWKDAA